MGKRDPRCAEPGCTFEAIKDQDRCVRHGGVVPVRAVGGAPIDAPGMRRCGATTRFGGCCKQPAIRGTTRCRMHGGSASQVRLKAAEVVREASIMEVARHYGMPRDVSPIDALTEELHRTQGHVDWLAQQIAAHPQDPNLLAVYTAERAHLAKLADAMVRSGVEQRRAVLSEQGLDAVEVALVGTLREFGLDSSGDHVRQVFARHLRAATGGRGPSDLRESSSPKVASDEVLPEPVCF